METRRSSFREKPEFLRGRTAERLIADELRRRGWYVIPSYDYSGEDNNKAPRLQGSAASFVIPDLDVAREGVRRWVEVKAKAQATWTVITRRYEHGINLRHYHHYCQVRSITGCPVWLCFFEENTRKAITQDLAILEPLARVYQGRKMGGDGMIFFPREVFAPLRIRGIARVRKT